ncbi:MAG: hypothetical protein K2X27_19925 [Candidatus Obscuribacterales bacterium]|nr:hypothetical protein [Candidatus Obscuribacterales bacterium]
MNEIKQAKEDAGVELTRSRLLASDDKPSALADLGRSFAYTLSQAPVEAVAQLIDGKANGDARKAVHFMDAPKPAEFGSANWMAQQAGSGLGAVLPVLVLHKGVSATLERNYGAKAALAMSENMAALTGKQAIASGGLKMAEAGMTGMLYSGLFSPVKADEANFWEAKGRSTLVAGMTFSTLSASGMGFKALAERSAERLPALSKVLGSEMGSAMLSGLPAGLVAANSESLLSGKGFAGARQQVEAVTSFALMNGGFSFINGRLQERRPEALNSEAPATYKNAGLDVDGRPLAESPRSAVSAKLSDYAPAEMGRARAQTLKDLSEIKALEPGKSVLDQFRDSGLSISQKYRVLNSLAQVREHFVQQRVNGRIEPDQQGNWIHTQGEFGRVIDAGRSNKLSATQAEDALLSSMFADAVKSKANFFTHHMDGALAADHVLGKEFGAGFNRNRLDGIVNAVREHQIGPPEFMAGLYANRIKGALNFKLSPEQESSLASLQKKMANPLSSEQTRSADGASVLKLSADEKALLNLTGVKEWYVPNESNPWNKVSRAVIDGDTIDNYYTPGGVGKIAGLGGPESDKWFMNKRIDSQEPAVDRATNIGSARHSALDAGTLITPASKALAQKGVAFTEEAIANAKAKAADFLAKEKGVDSTKETVPFFNSDLKYPNFGENDAQWWNIHRTPADKRSPEQQQFYDQHRFDGLSGKEQADFLQAKEIRDFVANELRAAQRLDGKQPAEYQPATAKAR